MAKQFFGEPWRAHKAADWNDFADAGLAARRRQRDVQTSVPPAFRPLNTAKVRNAAASAVPYFAALALRDPMIDDGDNEPEFLRIMNFEAYVAEAADVSLTPQKVAIAMQPLGIGALGDVCLAGVVPCTVDITSDGHRYAGLTEGQTYLTSSATPIAGGVEILWPTSGATGQKLCYVRLPVDGGGGSTLAFKTIACAGEADVVADAADDTLTLIEGTGIAITHNAANDEITFASTGTQNAFTTIVVSGQSDVVADQAADTLTLVAGNAITITTDAGADSITLALSATITSTHTFTQPVTINNYLKIQNIVDPGTPPTGYAFLSVVNNHFRMNLPNGSKCCVPCKPGTGIIGADTFGYWKFEEPSAPFADSGPKGHDATDGGTDQSATGKVGACRYWDAYAGGDVAINTGPHAVSAGADLTVCFWWKVVPGSSDTSTTQIFAITDGSTTLQAYGFGGGNAVTANITNNIVSAEASVPTPTDEQWHFYTIKWDSSAFTLSISIDDGTPDTDSEGGISFSTSLFMTMLGGRQNVSGQYTWLDEVLVQLAVLTSDQVTALHASGRGTDADCSPISQSDGGTGAHDSPGARAVSGTPAVARLGFRW